MALDPTLLETCLAILVIVANTASVAAEGLFSVRR